MFETRSKSLPERLAVQWGGGLTAEVGCEPRLKFGIGWVILISAVGVVRYSHLVVSDESSAVDAALVSCARKVASVR